MSAAAKAEAVALLRDLRRARGLSLRQALPLTVELYNLGQLAASDETRAALPSLALSSLRRWEAAARAGGQAALSDGRQRSGRRATLDGDAAMQELVVGLLVEHPHANAKHAMRALRARFEAGLPSYRAVQRWIADWRRDNAQVALALANPDAHKSRYRAAAGDAAAGVKRLNQVWELDSSPFDVVDAAGKRHALIGIIDVFSRRALLHVAHSSTAGAVAAALRKAVLRWGVPETCKTDNGSDYTSKHLARVFFDLDIHHRLCPPFSPEKKPFIERFFGTFQHGLVELLPGFVGHDVAGQQAIRSRRTFAARQGDGKLGEERPALATGLSAGELQDFCDTWSDQLYASEAHGGLGGQSPVAVARAWTGPVRRIDSERALDVLLAAAPGGDGWRSIGKKGLRLEGALFEAAAFGGHEGARVQVRLNDGDLGRVWVFAEDGSFLTEAICPERLGISRQRLAEARRERQAAELAEAKRRLRATARRADTADIAREILRAESERQAAVVEFPRAAESHDTPALTAAAAALDAPRLPTAPAAPVASSPATSAEVVRLPRALASTRPDDRYLRWVALDRAQAEGQPLAIEDERFWRSYRETAEWAALKEMDEDFGLSPAAAG